MHWWSCYYRFSYYVRLGSVFCFCFSLVFLSTSQEILWEECPRNDLFCVKWEVEHLLNSSPHKSQHRGSNVWSIMYEERMGPVDDFLMVCVEAYVSLLFGWLVKTTGVAFFSALCNYSAFRFCQFLWINFRVCWMIIILVSTFCRRKNWHSSLTLQSIWVASIEVRWCYSSSDCMVRYFSVLYWIHELNVQSHELHWLRLICIIC